MTKKRPNKIVAGREWDAHWQAYDASASMNPAQAYRRRLVLEAVRQGPAQRIADLGCGQGDLLMDLKRSVPGAQLLGVDASAQGLAVAAKKVAGLKRWTVDLEKGAVAPSAWRAWADVATCTEVMEHLDHPEALLKTAFSVLKPGGRLVLTVPGGPRSAYDLHIGHRQHFSPARVAKMLEGAGFRAVQAAGAGFPFFNLYRLTVISQGRSLIGRAARSDMGPVARLALGAFDQLFKLNLDRSPLGWQVFAIATRPSKAFLNKE